jgi:hypothetical protein
MPKKQEEIFMSLNDWMEIFRGGRQVDASGQEHDGDALIAKASASYDPTRHQAPVVIGHPKDDAPAYAWVEGLRETVRDGIKVLEAKLSQVDEGFAQLVQEGRFKMRSAAFYPDGNLRHLGFLGAAPPAVKGLKPVKFSGGDKFSTFEFIPESRDEPPGAAEGFIRRMFGELIEALKTKHEREFEEMDQEQTTGAAELKAQLEKERKEKEALAAQFAELQSKARREDLNRYLEGLADKGLILPYQQPGLLNFMEVLSQDESRTIAFCEGEGKAAVQVKPLDFFKKHLESLNRHQLFNEFGQRRDKEEPNPNQARVNLAAKM